MLDFCQVYNIVHNAMKLKIAVSQLETVMLLVCHTA